MARQRAGLGGRRQRRDPFADAASLDDFARISGIVFGAATRGMPMAIELGDTALPDDESEDAA